MNEEITLKVINNYQRIDFFQKNELLIFSRALSCVCVCKFVLFITHKFYLKISSDAFIHVFIKNN